MDPQTGPVRPGSGTVKDTCKEGGLVPQRVRIGKDTTASRPKGFLRTSLFPCVSRSSLSWSNVESPTVRFVYSSVLLREEREERGGPVTHTQDHD